MRAATIVGLLLVCKSVQPAEIYRCTDPEGAVTFSQTRCAVEARRIDLPADPPTIDGNVYPETGNAHGAPSDRARIDSNQSQTERANRREERERRERMRIMALEADRWGREAWRKWIADEKTSRSSTQQHR
jgi:hypothetical protein